MNDNGNIILDKDVFGTSFDIPEDLEFGMDYEISVAAVNSSGSGPIRTAPFTVGFDYVPEIPVIVSPDYGATLTPGDELSWTSTDNTNAYRVEIAYDEAFSYKVFEVSDVFQESIKLPDLQDGLYYLRVAAYNDFMGSSWSFSTKFFVENAGTSASETPEVEDPFMEDFLDSLYALSRRINYALNDEKAYRKAYKMWLLYQQREEDSKPVQAEKVTHIIEVEQNEKGQYFFKDGRYRKTGNQVQFKVYPPQGYYVSKISYHLKGDSTSYPISKFWQYYFFEMPDDNVVIDIVYSLGGHEYELQWTDNTCAVTSIPYVLRWELDDKVCTMRPIQYVLRWKDRICSIALPQYELQWADKLCIAEATNYQLEWGDRICVAKEYLGFQLEWNDRVCCLNTPTYSIEWNDRVCTLVPTLDPLEGGGSGIFTKPI